MIRLLRGAAVALPQVLAFLVVGAYDDLLGGWNHGDQAFGTLIVLFLLGPVVTLALLTTEITLFCLAWTRGQPKKSGWPILLAGLLLAEALALDLLILSQARM